MYLRGGDPDAKRPAPATSACQIDTKYSREVRDFLRGFATPRDQQGGLPHPSREARGWPGARFVSVGRGLCPVERRAVARPGPASRRRRASGEPQSSILASGSHGHRNLAPYWRNSPCALRTYLGSAGAYPRVSKGETTNSTRFRAWSAAPVCLLFVTTHTHHTHTNNKPRSGPGPADPTQNSVLTAFRLCRRGFEARRNSLTLRDACCRLPSYDAYIRTCRTSTQVYRRRPRARFPTRNAPQRGSGRAFATADHPGAAAHAGRADHPSCPQA